jgi:hypothetical protein
MNWYLLLVIVGLLFAVLGLLAGLVASRGRQGGPQTAARSRPPPRPQLPGAESDDAT